jgi:hypothetical protein
MQMLGDFRGAAKRIEDEDLPREGARIGVGEDEIHAVLDVEAAGSGFDAAGRPKMLPEPHVFYKRLQKRAPEKLAAAVGAGLAYRKWGEKPYDKGTNARYDRLRRMMEIDVVAALESCSWGLGQVMGYHWAMLGYDSPQSMVHAFMQDEDAHLKAMVDFIIANDLDDELRRHDWAGFARGYNGPGYRKNRYDTKLAARFAWWQSKPDTPYKRAA